MNDEMKNVPTTHAPQPTVSGTLSETLDIVIDNVQRLETQVRLARSVIAGPTPGKDEDVETPSPDSIMGFCKAILEAQNHIGQLLFQLEDVHKSL